jgi:hypothetical protein
MDTPNTRRTFIAAIDVSVAPTVDTPNSLRIASPALGVALWPNIEVAKLSKCSRAGALVDDSADITAARILKQFRFGCEVVLCPAAFAASGLSMFNPGIDPSL